jgi:hypothetical protein
MWGIVDDGMQSRILDESSGAKVFGCDYDVPLSKHARFAPGGDDLQGVGEERPATVQGEKLSSPESPALPSREHQSMGWARTRPPHLIHLIRQRFRAGRAHRLPNPLERGL